jgi:hypothetical protein
MAARNSPPPVPPPAAGPTPPPGADSVAALLRELSDANLVRLLGIVEGLPSAARDTQVGELLRSATAAVAERDPGRALEQLKQLATLDPRRAETLPSEPALASIRPTLEQLLNQLAAGAKLHAEGKLAEAARLLESVPVRNSLDREIRPETLLLISTALIEAGGLANSVRSAAVSDILVQEFRWAPAPHMEPVAASKPARGPWTTEWSLFLAWLAVGMVGAAVCWWLQFDRWETVLEVWGGALVVLACIAAWQRIRPS